MKGSFYLLFAGIFSVVLFSSFISSEAQSDPRELADPRIYFGSPTVAMQEKQIIVYSDSSKINGNADIIKSKVKSVNPNTEETDTINVWLSEMDDSGNFTGSLVRFVAGATDGTKFRIHAEIGNDIEVYIPKTSINYWGKVVSNSGGVQNYTDMRFNEEYSDCDNFPNPNNPNNPDIDEDGICDVWETGDELVITYLGSSGVANYTYNCDPACDNSKKDIFVEIDFMEGHGPVQIAVDHVKDAYSTSGVDDGKGIRLHVQKDESDSAFIPHNYDTEFPGKDITGLEGFDQIKALYFGTDTERDDSALWNSLGWNQKRQAFHYVLFVHTRAQSDSSGIAEIFGNDVMISLGNFKTIGNLDYQEGTLMHEIGHNLNLLHGGGDDVNCKPNYLSVMSYSRQFDEFGIDRKLDFSNAPLGTMSGPNSFLNETALFEEQGIGNYDMPEEGEIIFNNVQEITDNSLTGVSCVNWDPSTTCGANPGTSIDFDINSIQASDGIYLCSEPTLQVLYGFDDWTNIQLDSRGTGGFDDGVPSQNPRDSIRGPSDRCPPPLPDSVPEDVRKMFRSCAGGVDDGETKTSEGSREMTYQDIQTMRVIQIDQMESFIKNLPSVDSEKESQITSMELSPAFQEAREKIRMDDMEGAIDVISQLRKTFDERIFGPDREIAKNKATMLINSHVKSLQILDPTVERFASPQKQLDAEVSYKDVKCNRGLVLMVNEKLGDSICVIELTGIYLQSLGPEKTWGDYKFP